MNVTQLTTCDEGLTNPKRSKFGVTLALRGGDVCHPLGEGKWFEPPYFEKVLRFHMTSDIPISIAVIWAYLICTAFVIFDWWGVLAIPLFWLNPGLWTTWNLFGWRGYFGAKIYGVDSEAYKNWIDPKEVYNGSYAIHFSGRLKIGD